jgi:predicted Zn-dependent protease
MFGLAHAMAPGLGWVIGGVLGVSRCIARRVASQDSVVVPEPAFYREAERSNATSRSMQIRPQLGNPRVPAQRRLTALLAIQDVPTRYSAGLLRELLSDQVEDLRLLSYGMLEQKEKAISDQILQERERLDSVSESAKKLASQRTLARLYWELVHQSLVVGDMRRHCLDQVLEFSAAVLSAEPLDSSMVILQGRALLAAQRFGEAQQTLERAARMPSGRQRALPYLAECAFAQRDFAGVRNALLEVSEVPDMVLANCVEIWK